MKESPGRGVYRRFLGLLPEDMRRRFGHEMEAVFEFRLREAGGSPLRMADVWARAVIDVAGHAIALRFDERGAHPMHTDSIIQDVRYALRGVRKSPGLAALAILTLALGIGASTATFSIVEGVLLQKLPYEEPDRLVLVWPEVNANKSMALLAEERVPSLDAVSGISAWTLTLTGAGQPLEIVGLKVSSNYFDILGVQPRLGRMFRPEEELPGAAGVVVLSHDLWVTAFGADPTVLDRTIELGGAEYERRRVIGVMPPGVDEFIEDVDLWIPLEGDPALGLQADRSWYVNYRVARLAPGATIERATAEVREYAAFVRSEVPGIISAEEAEVATVQAVGDYLTRDVRASIWIALGTVGMVLLIGCFNVANLLLARGERRMRDFAVRAALGADRFRVTRMLLTEAGILGIAGGALGVLTAFALVRLVVGQAPENLPGIGSVYVSPVVLAFAVGITVFATLAAGVIPSWRAGRVDALASLGGGTRGGAGRDRGRLTPVLVGTQIALAVVVTIGSGLMLRSLSSLMAIDPGIEGEGVMAFKPVPPSTAYPDGEAYRAYYREVNDAIGALPFVESVGGIHLLPGRLNNWSFPTFPEGFVVEADEPTPSVNFRAVRGDYFDVTGMRLLRGRAPSDSDREGTEPIVVVNETFASSFWPEADPIGKTLRLFSADGAPYRVVGLVADVHQHGREMEPLAEMYFSHEQVPWNQMSLWVLARVRPSEGGPEAYAAALRDAVWSIDPDVPVTGMAHMSDVLVETTRGTRFITLLLGTFGALALVLCAVGVFGVTAYASGRRTAEFGVRLALGSSRGSILRSAVGRSLVPVGVGLAIGLVAAVASSRLLESALFGVSASDPTTFVGVAFILVATAACAALVPAWLSTRVDPAEVLTGD